MIINILLIIFWLILMPIIFGKILVKNNENTIMYSWTIGNIFQMGIFFVISIICVLSRISFFILWKFYSALLVILLVLGLIFFRKKIFNKAKINNITESLIVFKILAILLIIIQLFVKVKYANVNNDDATFVVLSQDMIRTGEMYYKGESNLQARKALAPIGAYFSTIAKQVNIDVTIVTHSIMPLFLLIMSYNVYFSFSRRIFKNDENSYIMLIFLSVLNLYTINVKGISKYMLLYTWFGRAILGSITLPLAWKLALDAMTTKAKFREWLILLFCVLASCLSSQMAVPLISISLGCFALLSAISDKKISYLFKTLICIIPCLIVGVIYINIK